jgi:hypothetical protein
VDKECAGSTTTGSPVTDIANFLGGFVAAEGCFVREPDRTRFRFSIGLGAVDAGMCAAFAALLGCGRVRHYHRRQPHYDDEVVFVVQSHRDLVDVVVPFMDAHLPSSYKRSQYVAWRAKLLDYWEHRSRSRRDRRSGGPA